MLAGKKNELTLRVLRKMRQQGAPKKVALISGMTEDTESLEPEAKDEAPIMESKKKRPSKA